MAQFYKRAAVGVLPLGINNFLAPYAARLVNYLCVVIVGGSIILKVTRITSCVAQQVQPVIVRFSTRVNYSYVQCFCLYVYRKMYIEAWPLFEVLLENL